MRMISRTRTVIAGASRPAAMKALAGVQKFVVWAGREPNVKDVTAEMIDRFEREASLTPSVRRYCARVVRHVVRA